MMYLKGLIILGIVLTPMAPATAEDLQTRLAALENAYDLPVNRGGVFLQRLAALEAAHHSLAEAQTLAHEEIERLQTTLALMTAERDQTQAELEALTRECRQVKLPDSGEIIRNPQDIFKPRAEILADCERNGKDFAECIGINRDIRIRPISPIPPSPGPLLEQQSIQ